MGIFSDTYDEFKKASPKEKLLIGGGVLLVGGIAFYEYKKGSAGNTTPQGSNLAGLPANFQQAAPGGAPGGANPPQGTTPLPPVPTPKPPTPTPTKPTSFIPVPSVPTLPARQSTTVTTVKASQPSSKPYVPPQYPHRPVGNYGIAPPAPAPARVAAQRTDILSLRNQPPAPVPGPTMSETQKRLINLNR